MDESLCDAPEGLKDGSHHGVVVIGSGYGASVMAARLATAGHGVTILERGREWKAPNFPSTLRKVRKQWRSRVNPLGLYDYRVGPHCDVFCGNGLGGTSLINASVAIRPDRALFEQPEWPTAIREGGLDALEAYYRRAWDMLGVCAAKEPIGNALRKVTAFREATQSRGASFGAANICVNFDRDAAVRNPQGMRQAPCTHCGDCVTGCNVGAKNSVDQNYLPAARSAGARIYDCAEIESVEPAKGGDYWVTLQHRHGRSKCKRIRCRAVVFGAGVLGTTGILLRSRSLGLRVSNMLGARFSSNGDVLGIGYNTDRVIGGVGFGTRSGVPPVGCTIMTVADYRDGRPLERGIVVEEGAIPSALAPALRRVMPVVKGDDTDSGVGDRLREWSRMLRDLLLPSRGRGALEHTMIYLSVGHDGAKGVIKLDRDRHAEIEWPEILERPVFPAIEKEMHGITAALGGEFMRNPRSWWLAGSNAVTVHPLGGCPMGDDPDRGVADDTGALFDPDTGAVIPDLVIADASLIPRSLGVNPFLTISAFAERAADEFNRRHPTPVRADDGK